MRPWPGLLVVVAVILFGACDPGFEYRPRGWQRVGEYEWSTSVNGVEVRTGSLGALISSKAVVPMFELHNSTGRTVSIEDARLVTGAQIFPVRLPGDGELRWRSAAPESVSSIPLYWMFEEYASELLGDRPRIVLDLRIGEERHQLEIMYERVE